VIELEISLEHSARTVADLRSALARQQSIVDELEAELDEERRESREAREMVAAVERRAGLVAGELCEARNNWEVNIEALLNDQ
jgi:hypothetical protein